MIGCFLTRVPDRVVLARADRVMVWPRRQGDKPQGQRPSERQSVTPETHCHTSTCFLFCRMQGTVNPSKYDGTEPMLAQRWLPMVNDGTEAA